jgi:photosystem II stability/assembly factor-like uncharacterized protein
MKNHFLLFLFACLVGANSCNKDKITLLTTAVNSNTGYSLYNIFYASDSIAYAVGGSRYAIGIIIRSLDGGYTWSQPDSISPKVLYTSFFFNPAQGFCGGYDSWLMYTQDSGQNFTGSPGDYNPINAIAFINHNQGVRVAGQGYASGVTAYTADGGSTWTSTSYGNTLNTVQYVDSNTVFASGYGVVYKSMDGGQTFQPTNAYGDNFLSMDFPTATTGYFAGYEGEILKTTDQGASFHKVRSGNAPFSPRIHFETMKFWDENTGYVAGDAGVMYQTTDGGGKWDKVKPFTDVSIRTIYLFSATSGIVAGDNGKIFLFTQ